MVHSSQEETKSRLPLFDLTFNFALSARLLGRVGGAPSPSDQSLPFGFASRENFPNGFLGTKTKFAFRNGKLIVDNYALAPQPTGSIPPLVVLWPLWDGFPSFHLVVFREMLALGKASYYIELVERSESNLASFVSKILIHSISTNVNWWILFL